MNSFRRGPALCYELVCGSWNGKDRAQVRAGKDLTRNNHLEQDTGFWAFISSYVSGVPLCQGPLGMPRTDPLKYPEGT